MDFKQRKLKKKWCNRNYWNYSLKMKLSLTSTAILLNFIRVFATPVNASDKIQYDAPLVHKLYGTHYTKKKHQKIHLSDIQDFYWTCFKYMFSYRYHWQYRKLEKLLNVTWFPSAYWSVLQLSIILLGYT